MKHLAILFLALGLLAAAPASGLIAPAYATGSGGDGGEGDGGDGGEAPGLVGGGGGSAGEGGGADCQGYHCGNVFGQTGSRGPSGNIGFPFLRLITFGLVR